MDAVIIALPNEKELLARATTKPEAFSAIYDHYFPRVFNYAFYRVNDASAADDITAQVFERTLRKLESYNSERAPFAAWLFAIARNTVNQYLRTQRRRRWISLDFLYGRKTDDPNPEETLVLGESHTELVTAVESLSNRERDIIALKFVAGLTNRRIASITGLSESNVSVILYRSLRKLRTKLSNRELDHE